MYKSFIHCALTSASLLLVTFCYAQSTSENRVIWWEPELNLTSLSDIPVALHASVTKNGAPVSLQLSSALGEKATVHSCNEYLSATARKMYPENLFAPDSAFIERCYALRYLSNAAKPRHSYLPTAWSATSLEVLPPYVVNAENTLEARAARAREAHKSWHEYDPSLTIGQHTAHTLIFENGSSRWFLKTIATGDFNSDGFEDEIVLACNSNRTGASVGYCFPMVLTAFQAKQVLTSINFAKEPYQLMPSSAGTH